MSRPGRVPRGRVPVPGEAWAGSAPGRVPRGRALAGQWVRAGIARPGRVPRDEDPSSIESTEARGTRGACGIGVEHPGGAGASAAGAGCAERGLVEAELHIRPEPVIGRSAESCGNVPAFNAGEILPCAERPSLHMGEQHQEADDSQEPRNHEENPELLHEGAPAQCATSPERPEKTRTTGERSAPGDPSQRQSGPATAGAARTAREPGTTGGAACPHHPNPATVSPAARRPATRTSRGAAPARPAARSRPAPDGPAPRR